MDIRLLAWARAVKARRRQSRPIRPGAALALPPLWLFSDWQRLPDPAALLVQLPPGLCGLVWRPARGEGPGALRRLRGLCRARRVALSVAGPHGASGCGDHRAGGQSRRRQWRAAFATASAHNAAELLRAERSGAALVFLSPVFPTASHPGAPSLGVLRWAALARGRTIPVLALGGITGQSARRLPRFAAGAGAIGALLPSGHSVSVLP